MHDLKIENALLVTGREEAALRPGSVAVKDGRIAALGHGVAGAARQVLDAGGQVVCPGFIDLHTHCTPGPNLNYLQAGVTTVVGGNCGFGRLGDLPRSTAGRSGVNLGALVGHNSVRQEVMGNVDRAPTAAELERMAALVEQDMAGGAMGFSAGLTYVPGHYAATPELVRLARRAAEAGGIYTVHMRDEGAGVLDSIAETVRIGEQAGLPAHISHLKVSGAHVWGRAREVLATLDAARARGVDVTWDQYPYTASCGRIWLLFSQRLQAGTAEERQARLLDPAGRAEAKADLTACFERNYAGDMTRVTIVGGPDPALTSRTLAEASRAAGRSAAVPDVADTVLDLVTRYPDLTAIYCVFHSMSESDVRAILRHPGTMVASDGWSVAFGVGHHHPRQYGTCPRVLGRYARDERLFPLAEAVGRMTRMPAARLGLRDRGVLAEGAWADLVVFDPAAIRDRATFENPHQYPEGIAWVLVNGQVVVDHGRDTGVRPGVFVARPECLV